LPRIVVVDPHRPRAEDVSRAVEVLERGGTVAYPTETFYGLAADSLNEEACASVFRLKGRGAEKALSCILSGSEQLSMVSEDVSPSAWRLAERFWPGPLTLVIPARRGLAVRAPDGTVAVRVSSLAIARSLAEALGRPITATSANRAGEASSETAADVVKAFDDEVDLVLDGGATPGGAPSTIVDATCDPPALIRRGAVDFALVLEASRT
jgi:L-threonylcarbamoyladenylate synthase